MELTTNAAHPSTTATPYLDRLERWLTYYHAHPRSRFALIAGLCVLNPLLNQISRQYINAYLSGPGKVFGLGVEVAVTATSYWLFRTFFITRGIRAGRVSGVVTYLVCLYGLMTAYALLGELVYAFHLFPVADGLVPSKFPKEIAGNASWLGYTLTFYVPIAMILLAFSLPVMAESLVLYATHLVKRARLKQASVQLELAFLKAQVSPHFLFNTLNNIYSLALQGNLSTSNVVNRLRHLVQFSTSGTQRTVIALTDEVTFLRDYIELERIRHGPRVSISFETHLHPAGPAQVPPFLLLPFVENAFKHGLNQTVGHAYARFSLRTAPGRLTFTAENSLPEQPVAQQPVGGIGLTNVRRRLALLFPDRHQLQLQNGPTTYRATLTITTN